MSLDFIEYPDREMLVISLADRIAAQLAQHLRTNDRASLCLPGGTTPMPVFDMLSDADLDWARVTVFLGDERWVPEDSPRSNSALIRRNLLKGEAAAANYLPLYTGTATPEEAVDDRAAAVTAHLPITVLMLGMGNDMHTASLFPGSPQLAAGLAADAPAVIAVSEGVPEPRLTLSAPALQSAIWSHLMITGPEKRAAVEAAQHLPPEEAPIRAVLGNTVVHWAE